MTRGMKRCFAQRPLPSMMMAIWRGTRGISGMMRVELGGRRVIILRNQLVHEKHEKHESIQRDSKLLIVTQKVNDLIAAIYLFRVFRVFRVFRGQLADFGIIPEAIIPCKDKIKRPSDRLL